MFSWVSLLVIQRVEFGAFIYGCHHTLLHTEPVQGLGDSTILFRAWMKVLTAKAKTMFAVFAFKVILDKNLIAVMLIAANTSRHCFADVPDYSPNNHNNTAEQKSHHG